MTPEQPAISYRDVSFRYPGAADPALQDISFHVRTGERLGVLGPNGGGKSTLLKLTLGLLDGADGDIRVAGLLPRDAARRGLIGYVPQKIEAELRFPLSVREVVAMPLLLPLHPFRSAPRELARAVDDALALVGASDLADRPIGRLSGGQIQRAMIARAIAGKPRVLLLDEPTVGIDVSGQHRFAELIRSINATLGITIVIVSHDIRTIAAGCDRAACLSRRLHFHDAPSGLTPAVLAELFRHDVAAIFGGEDARWHIDAHPAESCPLLEHRHPHTHAGPCDEAHDTPTSTPEHR